MPILLLALLAQTPAETTPDPTYEAIVCRAPAVGSSWFEVTNGCATWYVDLYDWSGDEPREAPIVWHLDDTVTMGREHLKPRTRIRYTGPSDSQARRIEVVTLGPLAMSAAVEDWVAEVSRDKMDAAFRPGQVEAVRQLGSRSWFVREAVSRALREEGTAALRLLVWARRSRDREVRARAEGLLSSMGWPD